MTTSVAFLGLGRMGTPMAGHLAAAGHPLTVWNRSPAVAEAFAAEHGARAAATPAAAVAGARVVITMLADDRALLDTYRRTDGVLAGIEPGALALDMSTVSPTTVQQVHDWVRERGASFVDAPVSGSVATAQAAGLTIMAAGAEADVDRAREVLDVLGARVLHLGPTGSGAAMKLSVNAIVHSLNQAVSEALVLAERAGIAREQAYEVFAGGAVAAPFVQYKRAAFERPGEVPVGFALELAAKDLRLALELSERVGASLPQTTTNLAVLDAAAAAGLGQDDESAVAVHLRSAAVQPARRPT
jgi:3-hydroxyisobutyrate dehydrogenase-like beta-hydroxyacid dehydrogenase